MNNVNQRLAFTVATTAEKYSESVKNAIAIAYNPRAVNPEVGNVKRPFFFFKP